MKYLHVFMMAALFLFAVAVHAADLEISESTIDFGTVKEGPPVIKTVMLTNNGTQPIKIAKAAAS